MKLSYLSIDTAKIATYLRFFRMGDERAMTLVYNKSFHNLVCFGTSLTRDAFLVTCLLHECCLKALMHTQIIEILTHIYRFIRINLRWQIFRQLIYGQMLCLDQFENAIIDFEDLVKHNESLGKHRQKHKTFTQTIHSLSSQAKQTVSLYFQKRLTNKKIAEQLGKTIVSKIFTELFPAEDLLENTEVSLPNHSPFSSCIYHPSLNFRPNRRSLQRHPKGKQAPFG